MLCDLIPKLAGFDKESEYQEFHPRPSLAGQSRCNRQLVYMGLNTPRKTISDRMFLTMDDSKWHEDLSMDWLRKGAYQVHSEQMKVDLPPPMKSGSIDWIITDIQNNDYLVEHKAINHFTFEKIWKGELPEDYFTQMALYFWGLQTSQPELTQGILLIKNKNTAQYIEFLVSYDKAKDILTILNKCNWLGEKVEYNVKYPDIVKTACDKFNLVLDYIGKKTLPKRQYELGDWQCSYCPYGDKCWEGYQKEIESLSKDLEMDSDIENAAGHFLELKMHIDEMEKEADEIKAIVRKALTDKNAQSGKAGEYVITLKVQEQKRINQELLTPEEIARATKTSYYEKLTIRKPKIKGEKNGK